MATATVNTAIMNARLWQWINGGWVKLLLRPHQSLTWGTACRTDKGWASECETWEHDGSGVLSTCESDGADCDGRISHTATFYCPLERLAWNEHEDGVLTPDWQRGNARQRDYSAEAAGY